jgi:alpha-L-fucosidase
MMNSPVLGAWFLTFAVKHHDGFCLYDSKLTDYKSTGSEAAWKHDVMRDVAEACHAAGLKLIVYYSQPDWHHPDYRTPRHAQRFREIGDWLKQCGESIYATRGGPFWGMDCMSTRKENRVYVHVLRWRGRSVHLPGIPCKILASRLLTGGSVKVTQSPQDIQIEAPPENRGALDTVVVLELDGPAAKLKPAMVPSGSLTFGKRVMASGFYPPRTDKGTGIRHLPEFAVDGDPCSTWTFDARAAKSAWLEVDLGRTCRFDAAEIREVNNRVRAFRIQAKREDRWVTIHEGGRIGEEYQASLAPVTARFVRLELLDAAPGPYVGPQIGEFHLYTAQTGPSQR